MADFTFTQRPAKLEALFGPVIATTYNNDEDGTVHALRIREWDGSTSNPIATLRQSPNPLGYAHFDIGTVLQRYVTFNPDLESIDELATSTNEGITFNLQAGYLQADGTFVADENTTNIFGFYIRKPFNEIIWEDEPYVPEMSNAGGAFNLILERGSILSNATYDTTPAADLPVKPPYISGDVIRMKRRREDTLTFSYLNWWRGSPLNSFNGINGFQIAGFTTSGTQIVTQDILNIVSNGGGPNTAFNSETNPEADTGIISVAAGNNFSFLDNDNVAYYYITPYSWYRDPDVSTVKIYPYLSVRVDIDGSECNDFDPIQFSWVNEFGVKDYFSFQKRNDRTVSIERNEYNKAFMDWSETTFDPGLNTRGRSVYNISQEESYVANTRYLTDAESTYLENLYKSPEVKVRFHGSTDWLPVVVTDTQFTEQTFRKNKLFQHTIGFKMANNNKLQNG